MERKWHGRYPQKFRIRAVERMNSCDNVLRLARELRLNRGLLYKWRHRLDPANDQAQSEATVRNSTESTLRMEIDKLKRLLANKTVEVDFFSCALQKVRLDAGTAVSLAGRRLPCNPRRRCKAA